MDIKALIKDSEWRTPRKLGLALHEKLGAPVKPKAESIANYVIKLAAGTRNWFLLGSSAPYRAALADMLGVEELELFPELEAAKSATPYASSDWPALRPFDPRSDEPPVDAGVVEDVESFRAGDTEQPAPGLLEYLLRAGATAHRWIQVPAGGGKSFCLAFLGHGGRPTVRVAHLRDVGGLELRNRHVLLVEDEERDTDAAWVDRLAASEQSGLVVLATFPLPGERDAATWRRRGASGNTSPGSRWHWISSRWRGDPACRREVIRWAAERVRGESLFVEDAAQVASWLDDVDPAAESVGTPEAVLWVSARVHELGLPKCRRLGLLGLFGAYIDTLARRSEDRSPDTAAWLRERGERAVDGLLAGRVRDMGLPGWNRAPAERWAELLPESLRDSPISGDDLETLARTRSATDRDRVARELRARLAVRTSDEAVHRLRQAGILVAAGNGRLDLEPAWYVTAWLSQWLRGQVTSHDMAWGRLSFDPERRTAVDRALDAVIDDAKAARSLADRLPERPRTADGIGAVEAVFAVVARTLARSAPVGLTPDQLRRVAAAQIGCCIHRYNGPHAPVPVSRRGSADPWLDEPTWHRDCWTWSFEVPRPELAIPADMLWLFPGWTRPAVSTLPRDFLIMERDGGRMFDYLVRMFVEDPTDRPLDNAISEVWTAWVCAELSRGGQPDLPEQAHVEWDLLAALIGPADSELDARWGQGQNLVRLVMSSTRKQDGAAWLLTQDQYPHLKNLFLACVDGSLAVEAAERTGLDRHGVLELIKRLPARTHLALVQWSTARNPKAWQHGSRDEGDYVSEEAVGWLAQTFAEDSWNTMRSWTLRNPVAALDWLVSKRLDSKSAHAVMSNLPPDLEVRLLEWIEAQEPKDRPDNVFWWAAVTIERRPELADRLLPLLRFAVPDTPGLVH